jgi:flagellar basal body-associated protein FliL
MKKDRFLIGILIFIGVLVVASVVLFFVRGQNQATVRMIHRMES